MRNYFFIPNPKAFIILKSIYQLSRRYTELLRKTGLHVLFVFILILTLSLTIPNSSGSGSTVPSIEWYRQYGGSGTVAYSVVQTSDGGYALAGYVQSNDPYRTNFWLVKVDSKGNKIWNETYAAFGGTADAVAYSAVQTSDKGYALAGSLGSYGAGLVKFSPDRSTGSLSNSSFSVDSWLIITIVTVVVIGAVVGGAIYYFRKRKPPIPPPPPQT